MSEGGDCCFLLQEKKKPEYLEGLPEKMKLYSEFLGKQPWFAGNTKVAREGLRSLASTHFLVTVTEASAHRCG